MKIARLVILGIAVAAGGGAALLAGRSDARPPPAPAPVVSIDTVEVLVAVKDINKGQALQATDLGWRAWPTASASPLFTRKDEHPDAIEQFVGDRTLVTVANGEPLRESKLIKAKGSGYMAAILPPGMRAVSTEISPETGAGGFILPDDRVDVILSRRDRESERLTGIESMVAETVLSDVQVLAIDQTVEEKNGQRVVVGKTATLALTARQAETLAMSHLMGTLSLALRSLSDADPTKLPTVRDRDNGSTGRVNLVRFGVTTTTIPK